MISLLIIAILEFIISAAGTFGNILTCIAVFKNQRLHNAACFCVVSLAIADLLTCSVLVLIRGFQHVGEYAQNAFLSSLGSTVIGFIGRSTLLVSFMHLALLSLDRVTAVSFPFFYQVHIKNSPLKVSKVLIFCWILPIIFTCIGDYAVDKKDSFVIFVTWVISMTVVILFSGVQIMIVVRRQLRFRRKIGRSDLSYRAHSTAVETVKTEDLTIKENVRNELKTVRYNLKPKENHALHKEERQQKERQQKEEREGQEEKEGKDEQQVQDEQQKQEQQEKGMTGNEFSKIDGCEKQGTILKVENENFTEMPPRNEREISFQQNEYPYHNLIKDGEKNVNRCFTCNENKDVDICICGHNSTSITPVFCSNEKDLGDLQMIIQGVRKYRFSQESKETTINSPCCFNKENPSKVMKSINQNKTRQRLQHECDADEKINLQISCCREGRTNFESKKKDVGWDYSQTTSENEIKPCSCVFTVNALTCNETSESSQGHTIAQTRSSNSKKTELQQSERQFSKRSNTYLGKNSVSNDCKVDCDKAYSVVWEDQIKNSKNEVLLPNYPDFARCNEAQAFNYTNVHKNTITSGNAEKCSVEVLPDKNSKSCNTDSNDEDLFSNVNPPHGKILPKGKLEQSKTMECNCDKNSGEKTSEEKSKKVSKLEFTNPVELNKRSLSAHYIQEDANMKEWGRNYEYLCESEITEVRNVNANNDGTLESLTMQKEPPCCPVTNDLIIKGDRINEPLMIKPIIACNSMDYNKTGEDGMINLSLNSTNEESHRNRNDLGENSGLQKTKIQNDDDSLNGNKQRQYNGNSGFNLHLESHYSRDQNPLDTEANEKESNRTDCHDPESKSCIEEPNSQKQFFILSHQCPIVRQTNSSDNNKSIDIYPADLENYSMLDNRRSNKTTTILNPSGAKLNTKDRKKCSIKDIDETNNTERRFDSVSSYEMLTKSHLNSSIDDKISQTVLSSQPKSFSSYCDSANELEKLMKCSSREKCIATRQNERILDEVEMAAASRHFEQKLCPRVCQNKKTSTNTAKNGFKSQNISKYNAFTSANSTSQVSYTSLRSSFNQNSEWIILDNKYRRNNKGINKQIVRVSPLLKGQCLKHNAAHKQDILVGERNPSALESTQNNAGEIILSLQNYANADPTSNHVSSKRKKQAVCVEANTQCPNSDTSVQAHEIRQSLNVTSKEQSTALPNSTALLLGKENKIIPQSVITSVNIGADHFIEFSSVMLKQLPKETTLPVSTSLYLCKEKQVIPERSTPVYNGTEVLDEIEDTEIKDALFEPYNSGITMERKLELSPVSEEYSSLAIKDMTNGNSNSKCKNETIESFLTCPNDQISQRPSDSILDEHSKHPRIILNGNANRSGDTSSKNEPRSSKTEISGAGMTNLSIQSNQNKTHPNSDISTRSFTNAIRANSRRSSLRVFMISKDERKTVLSVTVVLIAFVLLVYPRVIQVIYNFFNPVTASTRIVLLWLRVLMYSNSAINPLVYAWRMPEFRKTFTSMLRTVKNRVTAA